LEVIDTLRVRLTQLFRIARAAYRTRLTSSLATWSINVRKLKAKTWYDTQHTAIQAEEEKLEKDTAQLTAREKTLETRHIQLLEKKEIQSAIIKKLSE
jgi:hypothetical protein